MIFDEDFDADVESEEDKTEHTLLLETKMGKKTYFFDQTKSKHAIIPIKTKEDIENYVKRRNDPNEDFYISGKYGDYAEIIEYTSSSEDHDTVTSIDNGFYTIKFSDKIGYFLTEEDISSGDSYVDLGGELGKVDKCVENFYTKENIYKENGMKHKMGVLMYGPPGNGKSMLLRELMKKYQNQAVIIFIDSQFPSAFMKKLKNFDQKYIFVFEELTQNISNQRELAQLLLFLDGENSLSQQLVFATTNYPQELSGNLANRPGRFDKLFNIDNPTDEVRRKYLTEKLGEFDDKIITLTKGHSIAYLKEMIISSKINDTTLEEEIKINKDRMKLVEGAFEPPRKGMGF